MYQTEKYAIAYTILLKKCNCMKWWSFHFIILEKLENAFRKFWRTTESNFLIYIEVGKQKFLFSWKTFEN